MTPETLAHQCTFLELTEAKRDFSTYIGTILRVSDGPQAMWAGWLKDVQIASRELKVPQEVMDYFQSVKGLAKPPTSEVATVPKTKGPKFAWSPSKLACFELCPAKFAAEYFYKTVPYTETVHTLWGNRVHSESERFMKKQSSTDPEALECVAPFLNVLDRLPGQRYVEYRIGLTEAWKPVAVPITNKPWDWGDAIGRMAVDLAIINGKVLKGFDYKTGKMKDDESQLRINALCVALLHPEVEEFDMKYIWLKDKKTTGFKLNRKDLVPVYKDIKSRVGRLKEAWDSEVFVARKNYLCESWCGNAKCPFNGGRK
jgi:hypothetical protein